MKGETKSAGFTIVEALIVLAVTSALFIAVTVLIGGKQNKAQFQQSVRSIQTKVQQTINEVATGYYPNAGDFTCQVGTDPANGTKIPTFIATPAVQGKSQDCIFVGKVMQFSVNAASPEKYNTYSIAALRSATSNADTQSVVMNPPAGAQPVTQNDVLTYGLTTKYMCYSTGSNCLSPVSNPINAVGFISDVGSLDSGKTYEAGTLNLVALRGLSLAADDTATIAKINGNHLQPPQDIINPAGGVLICFQSGSTNDTAVLSIGSNGHNMAVKLEVRAC
jgi:type II secretory pathway pseudopilin PulG